MGTRQKAPAQEVPPLHPAGDVDCEDFLELIYGDREAWVDLPAKVGRYWVPFYYEWPNESRTTRRIDSSLRDREDLYYSVCMFSRKGRRIEDVLPTGWLWADLDEVHPTSAAPLGLLPTVAVESSPGRYQALWKLDRELSPKVLEKLNRGLTYALDADKGGWDLTQVLRIPGTRNFKYSQAPMVRLLWMSEEVYDPREVWKAVRELVPARELQGVVGAAIPRKPIPARAKRLLRTGVDQVVEGERSARLWELECLLAESGLGADEIYDLVERSAWNKWRGVASGRDRLRRDIQKALRHVAQHAQVPERAKRDEKESEDEDKVSSGDVSEDVDEAGRLPWIGYGSFMSMAMTEPRWMIRDLWTAGSQGLIAGEPKTNKTTLALAMGLSVASGVPFMRHVGYEVETPGPVLFVQEENAPWMVQDRLRKLTAYYGLRAEGALPMRFLNNFGFNLGLEEHRDMLEAEVAELRPALVVLDPMYLVLPADENSSTALQPFLKWLMGLRYEYGCAVIVIHHYRKLQVGKGGGLGNVRPGQRVMGSATLHGWVDSALYMSWVDEEREGWVKVGIEREFRSVAPRGALELGLSLGEPGVDDGMLSELRALGGLVDGMTEAVAANPGITVKELAELLGKDRRTVLARIRGTEGFEIETRKFGAGEQHKIYLAGTGRNGNG